LKQLSVEELLLPKILHCERRKGESPCSCKNKKLTNDLRENVEKAMLPIEKARQCHEVNDDQRKNFVQEGQLQQIFAVPE